MMNKAVIVSLALVGACIVNGCLSGGEAGVGAPEENVAVVLAPNQTLQNATIAAANRWGWKTTVLSPTVVRCSIDQRSNHVAVDVVLEKDSFSIRGVESNIPVRKYEQWVTRLRREIVLRASR